MLTFANNDHLNGSQARGEKRRNQPDEDQHEFEDVVQFYHAW